MSIMTTRTNIPYRSQSHSS